MLNFRLNSPASYSWLAAAALGDMFITMGMVWYLVIKDRPRTQVAVTPGMNRKRVLSSTYFLVIMLTINIFTHSLIQTIAVRMVQFNALSLITQSLEFVLFLTKTGLYFSLFTAALCKVYAVSFRLQSLVSMKYSDFHLTLKFSLLISRKRRLLLYVLRLLSTE